jgi:L-alanine-DL-glutamate epimerase-like enolase superfamily enzyme
MRITDVRTVLYEYPLLRPLGDVQWAGAVRNAELAVFLGTDEGPVGVGIAGPGARSAVHGLGEELVGRDPRAVAAHWERLQRLAFKAGPHGTLGNAIAALDCALWDLRATASGVPLWRELGADTGRVHAYASGLDAALPDADLVAYYRRMAEVHGIRAGKLKIGREPHRDLERLGLMPDALLAGSGGGEVSLMVDANEFWTPKQAVRRITALEDGCIVLGEAPGLGLAFDEELLERATVERPSAVTLNAGYRRASDSGVAEVGRPRVADV